MRVHRARIDVAQIDVEAVRRMAAFVPQEHAPAAEAEVDFGGIWVVLDGAITKCRLFVEYLRVWEPPSIAFQSHLYCR